LGYLIKPRDLFENQSILEISNIVREAVNVSLGEQGLLEGESSLLPIQKLYFEEEYKENTANNQALLFEIGKSIDSNYLAEAIDILTSHHDALRFQYECKNNIWLQTYGEHKSVLETVSLEDITTEKFSDEITKVCQKNQDNLVIQKGEIFKVILIKTPDSELKDRLFIVGHHLVIDGVSWRILFSDLSRILENLQKGEEVNLGVKGHSYREWVNGLQEYVTKKSVESQVTYWLGGKNLCKELPVDKLIEEKTYETIAYQNMILDKENTSSLLKEVHQVYGTDINDFLLGCLALTIGQWSKQEEVVIGLEGHGREEISESIDVNSTVGWFTSLYPVCLSTNSNTAISEVITSTKESLRRVPNKGIGFGILKYMHPSEEIRQRLSTVKWDIIFNYLGQTDNSIDSDSWIARANECQGTEIGSKTPFNNKLEINGSVTNGELNLEWSYSSNEYNESTVEELITSYLTNLKELIVHCKEKDSRVFTPSDYGLEKEINQEELESFINTTTTTIDLEEIFKI